MNNSKFFYTRNKFISFIICLALIIACGSSLILEVNSVSRDSLIVEKEPEHILRLVEEEPNLYTKIWLNSDGTRSMEYFGEPVKYVDIEGNVKDKLLTFREERNGFYAEQSDIAYFFEKNLGNGIALSFDKTEVLMFPSGVDCEGQLSDDRETLTYRCDSSTEYEYLLTYSGYKENIIVSEYTGRTEYKFVYLTNGASIKQFEGKTFISDKNGNIRAMFSDVVVYTADEKNNTVGEMTVEELAENERYLLTIRLDDEYLSDPNTVYPLIVDPSIDIVYGENGVDGTYIEDATINSSAGTSGNGNSVFVGLRSTYGIARLLVSFPGLDLSPIYSSSYIVSAKYRMRDLMCYSTHLPVEVHQFNTTWYENTVNWSNTSPNNYNATILDTQTVYYRNGNYIPEGSTYSNTYDFDITGAVRNWKNSGNNTYKHQGVIFKTTNSIETGANEISVCFASFERASNKPRLYITYNDPYPIVTTTNVVVEAGNTFSIQYYAYNATAVFSSSNTSVATVNTSGVITGISDGIATIYIFFYRNGAMISALTCTVFVGSERYVFFRDDGRALSYSLEGIGAAYYTESSNGGGQNAIRMVFINAGGTNVYNIVPRYNRYVALTANADDTVSFENYDQTATNQKWKYVLASGNLECIHSDLSISEKKLVLDENDFLLYSDDYSSIGTAFANSFVPVTSISLPELTFPENHGAQCIYATMSPSGASYGSNATLWHTYESSNTNVAFFDNKNLLIIVSEGVTTITVTHKVTRVSASVNLIVTGSTQYITSLDQYYMYSISTGSGPTAKFMEIPSDPNGADDFAKGLGSDIPVDVTIGDEEDGVYDSHHMWKFVRYGNTSYYAICATHSDNQYVYWGTGDALTTDTPYNYSTTYDDLFQESLFASDLWCIELDNVSHCYKISSASDHLKCLYIDSNNKVKIGTASLQTNNGYIWKIGRVYFPANQDQLYDCFWKGKCCDNVFPQEVYVAVDINNANSGNYGSFSTHSFDTSVISFQEIKSAVESWNGISNRVSITCIEYSQLTDDMTVLAIIADCDDLIDYTIGLTVPVVNGQPQIYGNDDDHDWEYSLVFLSTNRFLNAGLDLESRKNTIQHEIGHVLKLKHPVEVINGYPNEYKGWETFPSMMMPKEPPLENSDIGSTYLGTVSGCYGTKYITIFDTACLKSRWEDILL